MGRLQEQFVMHAATPGAENLEGEKADEGAHRHAPGESFQAEVRAGVLTEREPGRTAAHNRHVVDKARERGNQELLTGMLYGHEDAADEDEHLAGQNNAAIVRGALDKFRRGAVDRQQLQKFLHPDEGRNQSSFIQMKAGTTRIKSAMPNVFSTLLKNFHPPFSSPATL